MVTSATTEVRAKRAKATAEVFTPDKLVCEMLSKLPKAMWEENKTFCDPAVGNGQFLVWILLKKLSLHHDPTGAIQSLYGVDIMNDNVNETRLRLLKIIYRCFKTVTEAQVRAVLTNIRHISGGSLHYNFEFDYQPTQEQIDKWMNQIYHFNDVGIFKAFNPISLGCSASYGEALRDRVCLSVNGMTQIFSESSPLPISQSRYPRSRGSETKSQCP
jgi:hypothetical protein